MQPLNGRVLCYAAAHPLCRRHRPPASVRLCCCHLPRPLLRRSRHLHSRRLHSPMLPPLPSCNPVVSLYRCLSLHASVAAYRLGHYSATANGIGRLLCFPSPPLPPLPAFALSLTRRLPPQLSPSSASLHYRLPTLLPPSAATFPPLLPVTAAASMCLCCCCLDDHFVAATHVGCSCRRFQRLLTPSSPSAAVCLHPPLSLAPTLATTPPPLLASAVARLRSLPTLLPPLVAISLHRRLPTLPPPFVAVFFCLL